MKDKFYTAWHEMKNEISKPRLPQQVVTEGHGFICTIAN